MHPIRTSRSYMQAIPPFLTYQILFNVFLLGYASLLNRAADWLIRSTGHVAISTGDFSFLFTSWQGILILAIVLVTLYLYVGFDINAKIALAGRWVRGESISMRGILAAAFGSLKSLLSPGGFLLVIYFAFFSPLMGVGYTISLTKDLRIPTFISSVIDATPSYQALFIALVIVFVLVGFINIFSIHGVVLDDLTLRDSAKQSFDIIKSHWWNYLLRMLLFGLRLAVIGVVVTILLGLMSLLLFGVALDHFGSAIDEMMTVEGTRFFLLVVVMLMTSVAFVLVTMSSPFVLIKMTKLYEEYTRGEAPEVQGRRSRLTPLL